MSTFGQRLREAREAADLSQIELSDMLNLPSSKSLSTWEKDKNKPDIQKLSQICKVLGVPYEYLFDTEEDTIYSHQDIAFFVKYANLDNYGKWVLDYNLEQQCARCKGEITIPVDNNTMQNEESSEQSLFLLPNDQPDYDEIKEQIPVLRKLKKESAYSYENILYGLFSKGYVKKMSIYLLIKIFGGKLIPSRKLFNDIKDIMTGALIIQ